MSEKISRRHFLKLAGIGAASTAVLTGCGPAARYVVRRPYSEMPEFNQTGVSTYYATACRECPAGCGLIVRTMEGRAIKAEGNPNHPVNRGKICSRGLTLVQGLYNPDRITGPRRLNTRGEASFQELTWEDAIAAVSGAFDSANRGGAAFLVGVASDHMHDLVTELAGGLGAQAPVRYDAGSMFDSRATLLEAVNRVYGVRQYPYFDLGHASVTFSFGANFLMDGLSPVSYSRAYGQFRQGNFGRRGYLVSFEARQSTTSGAADEWVPAVPGTEGQVARALGALIAERMGASASGSFSRVDVEAAAEASGVSVERLNHLADLFAQADAPLAIAGGGLMAYRDGLASTQAVLELNTLAGNLGQPGGVFFTENYQDEEPALSTFQDVRRLVQQMDDGQVQTLFIHGANPLFDLPPSLGFAPAMSKVPLVISFSPFLDETALQSDYILPDHTNLESWGYHTNMPGADRLAISAIQPVVAPLYNTRATADVLLAAAQAAGAGLNYTDEVDFMQQRLLPLLQEGGGIFSAPEVLTFWSQFLQNGGWWRTAAGLQGANAPTGGDDDEGESEAAPAASPEERQAAGENQFHLVTFTSMVGTGSGANRPWLQETPDPMTTVTWNSWIEIHPETAARLGIQNNDVVRVTSPVGEVEVPAYLYPAIRKDVVAIPFGQGHTVLGRYAEGRGVNPAKLLEVNQNEAGDLAIAETLVTLTLTGQRRTLARMESIEGVYGEESENTRGIGVGHPE